MEIMENKSHVFARTNTVTGNWEMNFSTYSNGEVTIVLLPVSHVAEEDFYKKINEEITGKTVIYELFKGNLDCLFYVNGRHDGTIEKVFKLADKLRRFNHPYRQAAIFAGLWLEHDIVDFSLASQRIHGDRPSDDNRQNKGQITDLDIYYFSAKNLQGYCLGNDNNKEKENIYMTHLRNMVDYLKELSRTYKIPNSVDPQSEDAECFEQISTLFSPQWEKKTNECPQWTKIDSCKNNNEVPTAKLADIRDAFVSKLIEALEKALVHKVLCNEKLKSVCPMNVFKKKFLDILLSNYHGGAHGSTEPCKEGECGMCKKCSIAREEYLFKALDEALARKEHTNIAIYYGLNHMKNIESFILERGFSLTHETWQVAVENPDKPN